MFDPYEHKRWNHDNISVSSVSVDDWDQLRYGADDEDEGYSVVLPPITVDTLENADFEIKKFDEQDWLWDNLNAYTTSDQDEKLDSWANANDFFDRYEWLVENWRAFLTADQIADVEEALAEAKDDHDTDALNEFRDSDEFQDWVDSLRPAMNYYWPVSLGYGVKPEEAAEAIDKYAGSTSLIWLEAPGTYAIVLTGGGMDLSWDICAAYICCGAIPPSRLLLNLPRFDGRFEDLILNTMLPLLAKHFARMAERARDEAFRLAEFLKRDKPNILPTVSVLADALKPLAEAPSVDGPDDDGVFLWLKVASVRRAQQLVAQVESQNQ